MRTEFDSVIGSVHWHAIADHMQVGLTEIDEAPPRGVFDEGITDIPLLGTVQSNTGVPLGISWSSKRNPLGNSLQSRAPRHGP